MIGQMLGPYEILEELGHGGMATVYRAYQKSMDRFVAIKVIHSAVKMDKTGLERFTREARLVARLEHAHILPVYDFDGEHDPPYIVMRYLAAGTLEELMKNESLTLDDVIQIFSHVGAALDYAHSQGVVHRDVKPSNIMVDDSGDAFLTDFGIARMIEGGLSLTTTGMAVGTPGYMAPEQVMENKVDGRADIYALGVILYEILAGVSPFSAETPMGIAFKHVHDPVPSVLIHNPDVPPPLEAVVWQALAKRPEERFQTAGEMVTAMVEATNIADPFQTRQFTNKSVVPNESLASTAGTGSVTTSPPPSFLRRYGLWIVGLLVIVAVGVFLLMQGDDDSTSSADETQTEQAMVAFQQTETATHAVTPTETSSHTPTNTNTPTPTDSPTHTPTDTPTPTTTDTPTNTPTPTFTPTTRPLALVPDEVGFGYLLEDNGNRIEDGQISIQERNTLTTGAEENLQGLIDGGVDSSDPAEISLWAESELDFDRYEETFLEFFIIEDSRVFIQTGQYALEGVTIGHSRDIQFSSRGECMHAQYIEETIVEFACYSGEDCTFTVERNEEIDLPGYWLVQIDFEEEELVDDPRAIRVAEAVELHEQLETRFNLFDVDCLKPLLPDEESGQSLLGESATPQPDETDEDEPDPTSTRRVIVTPTSTSSSLASPTNTSRPPTRTRTPPPPTATPTSNSGTVPTATKQPTANIPPTSTPVPPTATRRPTPTPTPQPVITIAPTLAPDKDGDGVPDSLDACPDEPGPATNGGCPVRDSDGDGIPDHLDDCPNEPGPLTNNGCPLPDNDGDGIPNILDNCPNKPGPASNGGCPLPTEAPGNGSSVTLIPGSIEG